jgi:hypothetical protein
MWQVKHLLLRATISRGVSERENISIVYFGIREQRFQPRIISSIYRILPTALGPEVYSASNKNEYQKQKNNVSVE